MEYAIVSILDRQFMVKPGSKIEVPGILGKEGDAYKDAKTLLIKDGEVKIGDPLTKEQVSFKINKLKKSTKIMVFKYKSKSRYRRKNGHRQDMTVLECVAAAPAKAKEVKAQPAKVTKEKAPAKKKTAKKE